MSADESSRLESVKRRISECLTQNPTAFTRLISATVLDFGDGTLVKYGKRVHEAEGYAIHLARAHTTTALLPKVFDIITDRSTKRT
jgi:hypothetical protein